MPPKNTYFISYYYEQGNERRFANNSVEITGEIDSLDVVRNIENHIGEKYHCDQVVLNNWKKL